LDEILRHTSAYTESLGADIVSKMNGLDYNQATADSFDTKRKGRLEFWPALYDLSENIDFRQPAPYTLIPLKAKMKKIPQSIKMFE